MVACERLNTSNSVTETECPMRPEAIDNTVTLKPSLCIFPTNEDNLKTKNFITPRRAILLFSPVSEPKYMPSRGKNERIQKLKRIPHHGREKLSYL